MAMDYCGKMTKIFEGAVNGEIWCSHAVSSVRVLQFTSSASRCTWPSAWGQPRMSKLKQHSMLGVEEIFKSSGLAPSFASRHPETLR